MLTRVCKLSVKYTQSLTKRKEKKKCVIVSALAGLFSAPGPLTYVERSCFARGVEQDVRRALIEL
jgi:hypothetical protein